MILESVKNGSSKQVVLNIGDLLHISILSKDVMKVDGVFSHIHVFDVVETF